MAENRPVALITGATSGIGEAYARRLARDGYDLIITGRRKEIINRLAEEIRKSAGVNVEVVIAELSSQDDIDLLSKKIQGMENLDLLINNAGYGVNDFFHKADLEPQEKMVAVHCVAPMKFMHAAIPQMLKRGKGAIINVASIRSFFPGRKAAAYSGTKAFLYKFSESIYIELMGTGVKIQVLCPGFTKTDFHGRIGIDTVAKNKGLMKWMSAEKVADISLAQLKSNKLLCIPGLVNKLIAMVAVLVPAKLIYKYAPGMGGSK